MKKKLIVIVFTLVLPFVFYSCDDEMMDQNVIAYDVELSDIEKRFLDYEQLKSAHESEWQLFVNEILIDLKKQNKHKRFINKFVEKYGYPNWEMARLFKGNEETVAQIPVLKDDACETGAIILVVKDNKKLKFKLLLRDKFDQFANNKKPLPDMEKIRDLFIIFDFLSYGESAYLPGGKIVFGDENPENEMLKSAGEWVENYYCYTLYVSMGDYSTLRWECESWFVYSPVTDEYAEGSPSGGGGTSEWYEEGSSGGSGTSTEPNPITPELIVLFNKYPCLDNILNTLMSGTVVDLENLTINSTLASDILSTFKLSKTVNLTLEVLDLQSSNVNGRTIRIEGTNDYKIILNESYVESATDLSIARTMIHEIMHANLLYKFDKKEEEYSVLLEMFYETQNPSENDLHHSYFADSLIPIIRDNLYEWCRQSSLAVSLDYCEMLAWAGLDGILEYENHPDKSEIAQININEKTNNSNAKGRNCN